MFIFKKKYFVYIAYSIVNLLTACSAMSFAWSSPVLPKLDGTEGPKFNPLPRPITTSEKSWITSILTLGAACSALFAGWIADMIGRTITLLILAVPAIIGNIILMFANNIPEFYCARFLVGVTAGGCFSMAPTLFSEISQTEGRGVLGVLFSVFIALSQLLILVVGPFVSITAISVMTVIPALCFIILVIIFIPETPYYLVMINKQDEAEQSLKKYMGKDDVTEELKQILESFDGQVEKASWGEILRDRIARKTVFLCFCMLFFEQFTGIQAITSYLQTIFEQTGSSIPANVSTMVYGAVAFLTTVLTSFLVEKFNRKTLLLFSQVCIIICIVFIGLYFYLKQLNYNMDMLFWLPITSIVVFNMSYNLGAGPVVLTMIGEILPPKIKSTTATVVMFFQICLVFFVTWSFPMLQDELGKAGSVWLFGGVTVFGVAFTYFFIPETRGKTFAEIQNEFKKH